jgi:hypothetical protein
MEIGDLVTHKGRTYVLRGVDPMSVPDRHVQLEDLVTGEQLYVPITEVSPQDP